MTFEILTNSTIRTVLLAVSALVALGGSATHQLTQHGREESVAKSSSRAKQPTTEAAREKPNSRPENNSAVASDSPQSGDPTSIAQLVLSPHEIYGQTIRSVVFVINDSNESIGTGWILDKDKRRIVTNQHVVEGADEVRLIFPDFEDGKLRVDFEDYSQATTVAGKVVDSQKSVDLGMIEAESMPKSARNLELAAESSSPGDRVHAIGGLPKGSEGFWKYSSGFVSQVSMGSPTGYRWRVMQSNIDINPGNSGGPIVNDRGQLVGVAQSVNLDARDVSYNIDIQVVREYVDTVRPLLDEPTPAHKAELGGRHLEEGRTRIAMRMLTEAIREDATLSKAHSERGWAFISQDDFLTAIDDFTTAIKLDARNDEAWYGRARAYRLLGDNDKAVTDASSGIANNPESANLYNERALVQEGLQKNDLALRDYSRAVELDPDNAVIRDNRANLYNTLGQYDAALVDIQRALELDPRNPWYHNRMGVTYYRAGNYAAAIKAFVAAIEINNSVAQFATNLADSLLQQGDFQGAITVADKAIGLGDQSAYVYFLRGSAYHRSGNNQAALADLNQSLQLDDNSAAAHYVRAQVLEQLGNSSDALVDYRRASEIDPRSYPFNQNNSSVTTNVSGNGVVGQWYVNQPIKSGRYEMNQIYYADGRYEARIVDSTNGTSKITMEQGTYRLEGELVVFNTNLGNYSMKISMENGMLWLYFPSFDTWLGSERQTT